MKRESVFRSILIGLRLTQIKLINKNEKIVVLAILKIDKQTLSALCLEPHVFQKLCIKQDSPHDFTDPVK